jgi:hypothetical protein
MSETTDLDAAAAKMAASYNEAAGGSCSGYYLWFALDGSGGSELFTEGTVAPLGVVVVQVRSEPMTVAEARGRLAAARGESDGWDEMSQPCPACQNGQPRNCTCVLACGAPGCTGWDERP